MKQVINKIWFILAIALVAVSCEDDELTKLNSGASTTMTLSTNDIVLEEANNGQEVLTISWSEPDYGFAAADEFLIDFDIAEGDFSAAETMTIAGDQSSKAFENEELNKKILNLGIEPDVPTEIKVRVRAAIQSSSSVNIVSNEESMMVTAYSSALDLTSNWGIVGSAAQNGWDGPDMPFYKVRDEDDAANFEFVAYVDLKEGEIKFRQDNEWTVNLGDNGLDGTLEQDGANIPVEAGSYKVLFNATTLTYTMEKYTWGLVGSATENGWDGPDMPLNYDSCSDTWKAFVFLNDGEWKIRKNNDWDTNYGDTGLDGSLEDRGDNIPVTEGYYQITVDFATLTYTIEEVDTWGIVGSGYNDWGGAGPDALLIPDYCNEGVYYINGVTLLDGEIKFRKNNDWGTNYGDTGLDGILELEGDNIPSSAGTYNVVVDFSNIDVPTYTITPN